MPSALRLLLPFALALGVSLAAPSAAAQQPTDTPLRNGFALPLGFTWHGANLMYVFERGGIVRVIHQGTLLAQPLLDIREEVGGWRDFGLLGMALDPNFATNGYYYLSYVVDRHHLLHYGTPSYNATTDEYLAATITRVTRFTADVATGFTTTVPGSRHVLLGVAPGDGAPITYESHGACQLAFGRDGTLLVAVGEGASFLIPGDWGGVPVTYVQQAIADGIMRPEEDVGAYRSQMVDSFSGKILRLDPVTGDGLPSNPFFDPAHPRSARSRVYALGLRNPCRMTVRPGTGSLDPALGRPGTIYLGDVGWITREELNVVTQPGQNFGWPLFEGIEPSPVYMPQQIENLDVPNPLLGQGGCGIAHLRFQDLLRQPVDGHSQFFPNPCNPQVGIAPTTPTFVHTPPVLEWHHSLDEARVPVFENGVLVARLLGSPEAGIPGNQFHGACSMGGTWHSGLTFPASFGPCYYHADFVEGWIRRFEFDAQDELLAVHEFGSSTLPLMLGESPVDHGLIHLGLTNEQFREIRYGIEPPPTARPTMDTAFGAVRTVNLDARDSSDPEGQALTYLWNLGNGRTSTAPQLGLPLRGLGGTPLQHQVQLTVTDPFGQSDTQTLAIAVDNTPPQVAITSFENGDLYSQTGATTLPLAATVVDAEHGPTQLTYEWRTALHHNSHVHPEPPDPAPATTASLSPTPHDAEFFAYSIELTVTDADGLSTTVRNWLFPDTTGASTSVLLTSPANGDRIAPGQDITFQSVTTGSVQRVEYYVEGELVGVATAPPYLATWTPTRTGRLAAIALAIGTDSTSSNTRGITFEVEQPTVTRCRVRGSTADAAEDMTSANPPVANGAALPLGDSTAPWLTGLQFSAPDVPVGARVQSAWIEFTAAAPNAQKTHLQVAFDRNPRAQPIGRRVKDLRGRVLGPLVNWSPMAWTTGESGPAQRTPDLTAALQPCIADPKWAHSLVALMQGTGMRQAVAYDGNYLVAPVLTIAWLPPLPKWTGGPTTADGVEEPSGTVDLGNNALLLGTSQGQPHLAAIQFTLDLEPGSKIDSARIQFTSAGTDSGPAVFTIRAQVADDAPPIATTPFDISNRPQTTASVTWYPPEWPTPGVAGPDQRTPELRDVLQEILDRPGWMPGQTIAVILEGTGTRTAASLDASPANAPHIDLSYQRP